MDFENLIEKFTKEEEERPKFKEEHTHCDILFVTDTKHIEYGKLSEFTEDAQDVFNELIASIDIKESVSYRVISAYKLVGFLDDHELSRDSINSHREILYNDIKAINPKLVIPLGNNAFKLITKKSGISNKRGCEFEFEGYTVVPTYSPDQIFYEPGLAELFIQDVKNSYDRFIKGKNKFSGSPYVYCDTLPLVLEEIENAIDSGLVSVDLETTGLDFKMDAITTFGCAYGEGRAFVIPMYHKDTPFTSEDLETIKEWISYLTSNDKVIKVMHNSKFDVKFLKAAGIECHNIEDTQVLHALIDENKPHRLVDLVKERYPEELENF